MADVSVRDAYKSYGKIEVLHGLNFDIADGEFVVIVGPSGCGKSTLLRMVAGLEVITSGSIAIGGEVVDDLEPKDRNIAMVFQNYALYPHMSVYRNMSYALRISRTPKEEIDRRVQEAARILQLEDLLDRRPGQLSGGQRQRVAMGRAIVREPAVFLFDEPLSNLDAKLRVQMRIEIRRLHDNLGATSIYVTHDQIEAMTLADRLIVMNSGNAEQIGAPLEVYESPATAFVAGFIGSPPMNFLSGRVSEDGSSVTLSEGQTVPVSGADLGAYAGCEVTVGIRPEHLIAADAGDERLTVKIDLVEALGADTLLYGEVGGKQVVARAPHDVRTRTGEVVHWALAPGKVHVFDPTSGLRIAGP